MILLIEKDITRYTRCPEKYLFPQKEPNSPQASQVKEILENLKKQ